MLLLLDPSVVTFGVCAGGRSMALRGPSLASCRCQQRSCHAAPCVKQEKRFAVALIIIYTEKSC